ncbi:MAG: hypothetical protein V2A34_16010, partial [Lentisphaerota bacterium]
MRMDKTSLVAVIVLLMSLYVVARSWADGATNASLDLPSGKLQALQEKANTRDVMARKVVTLEKEVDSLQGSLDATTN